MSFEKTSFPSPLHEVLANEPSPLGKSHSITHVDTPKLKKSISQLPKESCYESIERQRWEDEGGAQNDCTQTDDMTGSLKQA